jgi:hypothetical protein
VNNVFLSDLQTRAHVEGLKQLVSVRIGGALTKQAHKSFYTGRRLASLWSQLFHPLFMSRELFVAVALLAGIIHKTSAFAEAYFTSPNPNHPMSPTTRG